MSQICPECEAEIPAGAKTCESCGYSLPSGPATLLLARLRQTLEKLEPLLERAKPMLAKIKPLLQRLAPLVERAKAKPKLAGAIGAGTLLLIIVGMFFLGGDGENDKNDPNAGKKGDATATAGDKSSSGKQAYTPPINSGRNWLNQKEYDAAYQYLSKLDADKIVSELGQFLDKDSDRLVRRLVMQPLEDGSLSSLQALIDHTSFARKIMPEKADGLIEKELLKTMEKGGGPFSLEKPESLDLALMEKLPENVRLRLAINIATTAQETGVVPDIFFRWRNELADRLEDRSKSTYWKKFCALKWRDKAFVKHEKEFDATAKLLRSSQLTRETLERLSSSVVGLRNGDEYIQGIVVGIRDKEILVSFVGTASLADNSHKAEAWKINSGGQGKADWIAALRVSPERKLPKGIYPQTTRLLAFPRTDALKRLTPISLVSGTWDQVRYTLSWSGEKNGDMPPFKEWRIRPITSPQNRVGYLSLNTKGELIACWPSANPYDFEEVLSVLHEPKLLLRRFEADDKGQETVRIFYDLWDPSDVVTKTTALACAGCRPADCQQADRSYKETKGRLALPGTTKASIKRKAHKVTLSLEPPFPNNGSVTLVQPCLQLKDDTVVYFKPDVACISGNRTAGKDTWSAEGEGVRFFKARYQNRPLPLNHSVEGMRKRYSGMEAVELFLKPKTILLNQTGDHFYVADDIGIRRIRTSDFCETVGLPLRNRKVKGLIGSSHGLVVLIREGQKTSMQVFDPKTLELQYSLPLEAIPISITDDWKNPLAAFTGSWQNPFVAILNTKKLSLVDLGTKKLVQSLDMKEQHTLLFGAKKPFEKRYNNRIIKTAVLSHDGKHLYLLCENEIHRIRMTSDGLEKSAGNTLLCPTTAKQDNEDCCLIIDPQEQYAIVKKVIYDLRTAPPQAFNLHPKSAETPSQHGYFPKFIHVPTGRMLAGNRLLDHRGVEQMKFLGEFSPHSAEIHPNGKHCLLWSSESACWVALHEEKEMP